MKPSFALKSLFVTAVLALALLSACGTAPAAQTPAVNIEGSYNVAGKNPDGSGYGCMLNITNKGDVYDWYWFACGEYTGIGVQQGKVISVAWGASDCNIVSYEIQSDGKLKARWTPMSYTSFGSELATPKQNDGTLEGSYSVTGANPDGSKYEGTLDVNINGGVYNWKWNTGGEISGTGILRENIVSVAYGSAGCSVMSYLLHDDKTLDSLWAYIGSAEVGSESVTPLNAATPTALLGSLTGTVGQTASEAPIRPSIGCGKQPETMIGATTNVNIDINGMERLYLLHLPTNYDPNKPTSLVFNIHGYTDSAGGMESGTGMSRHADKFNYIVVYAQSTHFKSNGKIITSWNDLTCNASPGPQGPICSPTHDQYAIPSDCGPEVTKDGCNWCTCNDDLSYIEKVLDEAEANLCVDLNRVYATGMSNGGMFTHRLGCDMADRFAAIAPVSGTLARGFNCAPDTADQISIMNIHGREDDYVDVTGKESSDGYYYTAIDDVMSLWASPESQNCSAEETVYPTIADGKMGMKCTHHADCATGAQVVSCWWDAGHAWPGGTTPFGNDMIWDFFTQNPKTIQP